MKNVCKRDDKIEEINGEFYKFVATEDKTKAFLEASQRVFFKRLLRKL